MQTNALPSEYIVPAAAIDPDAYSAAAVSSGYVDMSLYEHVLAVAMVGDFVSTGKYDLALYEAAAASGGSAITGKAITQLTQAGSDSNKQALINLRRGELTEGNRYVKGLRTLTTAGADSTTMLLGIKPGFADNCLPSEVMALVGAIDPDANAPGDVSTGWIDMSAWHAMLAVVLVGDMGSATTLAGKFEQATSSGGAGVKDVTGVAISALDQSASPNPSNQQVTLDCRADDLDAENGFRYVRFTATGVDTTSPANATSDYAVALFGVWPKVGIASDFDAATVDEIV